MTWRDRQEKLREAVTQLLRAEPPPVTMSADEDQWWRETKKGVKRRLLRRSVFKALLIVGVMQIWGFRWEKFVAAGRLELLFSSTLILLLIAVFTGAFLLQSLFEPRAEEQKRLRARRMQQAILVEADHVEEPTALEDSRR